MFLEVLVEGAADQPTVREILQRHFGLTENQHFRLHPHQGKGRLPEHPLAKPEPKHRGLLDQLPAKLRGYASLPEGYCLVVLVDADDEPCKNLKAEMVKLYRQFNSRPPCALFRIAVEETESWFLADPAAISRAYPKAKIHKIPNERPDSIVGAWEVLAKVLGRKPEECSGADKHEWATRISLHLDFTDPKSPSLRAFINGVCRLLENT